MGNALLQRDAQVQETLVLRRSVSKKSPLRALPSHGQPRRAGVGPKVIGFVGASDAARDLVPLVAEVLAGRHDLEIITDRPQGWLDTTLAVHALPEKNRPRNRERALQYRLARDPKSARRTLVDVTQLDSAEELSGLLLPCEEVLWLVDAPQSEASLKRLQPVLEAAPGLAGRLHLAWVRQAKDTSLPRRLDMPFKLARPEFWVRREEDKVNRRDLLRLVHHLERITLGLALGGGGARGAAHVGVLRALEKAGIMVDRLAGTSMGAYIAAGYGFGFSRERILDLIVSEMAAPRKWRLVPGGGLAHMAWNYRNGGWRKKSRRAFGEHTPFEHFEIPVATVRADLASGQTVVRDQGDAIEALLESINFPGLARPILRDGMVLVDGGVLNNVPTNVLREGGADVVVAVDVAGKFSPAFGAYDPDAPDGAVQTPSALETIIRVMEVQMRALMNSKAHDPDLLITPETMAYGFTQYNLAHEIADAGEAAAEQALPALKKLLAGLGR